MFAPAANRWIGSVTIDGRLQGEAGLYSAETQWQLRAVFSGLASGKHLLVIQVTSKRRTSSEGTYIDVDQLQVQ